LLLDDKAAAVVPPMPPLMSSSSTLPPPALLEGNVNTFRSKNGPPPLHKTSELKDRSVGPPSSAVTASEMRVGEMSLSDDPAPSMTNQQQIRSEIAQGKNDNKSINQHSQEHQLHSAQQRQSAQQPQPATVAVKPPSTRVYRTIQRDCLQYSSIKLVLRNTKTNTETIVTQNDYKLRPNNPLYCYWKIPSKYWRKELPDGSGGSDIGGSGKMDNTPQKKNKQQGGGGGEKEGNIFCFSLMILFSLLFFLFTSFY
jgi:hypothetical protein